MRLNDVEQINVKQVKLLSVLILRNLFVLDDFLSGKLFRTNKIAVQLLWSRAIFIFTFLYSLKPTRFDILSVYVIKTGIVRVVF